MSPAEAAGPLHAALAMFPSSMSPVRSISMRNAAPNG